MLHLVQLATSPEAGALYVIVLGALEKKFQFIKPVEKWAKDHKSFVKSALAELGVVGNDVIHSPALATLKLELEKSKQQETLSNIYKAATAVLHNLTTRVEDMTPEQKSVAAVAIVGQVDKLFGLKVTVDQVSGALDEIQQLAEKVAPEPTVQGAQQITANSPTTTIPQQSA